MPPSLTSRFLPLQPVHLRVAVCAACIRAQVDGNSVPLPISLSQPATSDSSSDGEDLMVVVRDATPLPTGHDVEAQQAPAPVTPVASTIQSPSTLSAIPAAPSAGSSDTAVRQTAALPSALPAPSTVQPHSATPLAASSPRKVEAVRRRTARSRAGQHSPRPVNEVIQAEAPAAQSNAVLAFFRPWS
ncbi:hypothetical protein D9C73_006012 [Collichthys lucidus]|uniref:Uncharacterized protein n=1 Tax=Collichthys lucidus TaxID=240159 RepID=A0A4U5UC51_COLLU|nr:hypothetical protein D9C73_006012 [Collichthys lucidus]